jgi:flagellar motor switch protein FliN
MYSKTAVGTITDEEREQLILEHLPQVRLIARRIQERLPKNISFEDLVSTGILGLISAIDNFDPSHNVKLKTYAEYKIRGAILDSLRGLDWAPRQKRRKTKQIEAAIVAAEQRLQATPSEEDIAAQLEISLEEYHEWLVEIRGLNVASLEFGGAEHTRDLLHFVPDSEEHLPSVLLEKSELERLLAESIDQIPQIEHHPQPLLSRRADAAGDRRGGPPARIANLSTQVTGHPPAACPFIRTMAHHARSGNGMSSLQPLEAARALIDGWVENLAQILESVMEQRPSVAWREVKGAAASLGLSPGTDVVCCGHKFFCPQEAQVWVTAPGETWQYIGTSTLKAAGLETSDAAEVKNTWLEILGHWQSAVTRVLASQLGHEVTGEAGSDTVPETHNEWLLVSLHFGETELPPLAVAFVPSLPNLLTSPPSQAGQATAPAKTDCDDPSPTNEALSAPRTMDLLLELELPVSISFGKRQLPLKDVLKLTTGSIVELNRGVNEPVEILINHCLVARGEVVVVEGNYGVRIQQIASRLDRLRSIR